MFSPPFVKSMEIRPLDRDAMEKARIRQSMLAKPPGSLGMLEELSVQMAGITGRVRNEIRSKRLFVFAADNGVCAEGVTSAPQSVTAAQTAGLAKCRAGGAVIAKHFGCEVTVIDVGVAENVNVDGVINKKIAYGTRNIAVGPAMTRQEAEAAMKVGFDAAFSSTEDIIGVGEMGIGNTTTSSAVLAALTNSDAAVVTGRGGGITDESYARKIKVIERALAVNSPDPTDAVDVIAKVGGLDIAAMAGAFLGGAARRVPVVIDGFISIVAALCASRICPVAREYMIASHESFEVGYRIASRELSLCPMLKLGMRLGEGSGCPLAFEIVSASCAVMNGMATFAEADIDDGYLDEIRKGDKFTVRGDET